MKFTEPFNRASAAVTLNSMKKLFFIIDGRKEQFQSYSIHPTGNRILITTDHKTRETNIRDLHLHLDMYEPKQIRPAKEIVDEFKREVGEIPVTRQTSKPAAKASAAQVAPKVIPVKQKEPEPVVREVKPVVIPNHVGESKDKIFFTTDYTLFKQLEGNRNLNQKKISRIVKDIESGIDMLPYCPIIVDTDFYVVDGQHRLYIAQQLGKPVYFVVSQQLTLHEVAKVNSNTERWKGSDFIHCYLTQGNEHYKKLQEFIDTYDVPISVALNLLMGKNSEAGTGAIKDIFEKGGFVVTQYEFGVQVMERAKMFEAHTGWKTGSFIAAIQKLINAEKVNWHHLQTKFDENPEALKVCGSAKQYLNELEIIYNRKASIRKPIW